MEENKEQDGFPIENTENLFENQVSNGGSEAKGDVNDIAQHSQVREKSQGIPKQQEEANLVEEENEEQNLFQQHQQHEEEELVEMNEQHEQDGPYEVGDPQEAELQNNQEEQEGNPYLYMQNNLFNLVNSISSTNLLSEESIMALKEMLCPPNPKLDAINLKEPKIDEYILMSIIKDKSISALNALGDALNYYHKMLMDSQIHHLDKLIRIIKSKKREMHLRSVRTSPNKIMYFGEGLDQNEAQPANKEGLEEMQESREKRNEIAEGDGMSDDPMDIVGLLEHNQLGNMILKKKVLPTYNPSDKSICFTVNNKYEVKLKICDDTIVTQKSKIDRIPAHIMQTYIFPYLTSSELFSMRAVCNEWRDMVRGTWHTIFKREMLDQIVAADLCNDIELHFKLMQIRAPFYQKFGVFMNAIIEMIDWNGLDNVLMEGQNLGKQEKMVMVTLLKMLGHNIELEKLWDYQESIWEGVKDLTGSEIKDKMYSVLDKEFIFDSNLELEKFKKNFIDSPDISITHLKGLENKTFLMFALFMRQMYVFGMLRNHLAISQKYVLIAKERLKEVSRGWSSKKGFLEGAYKILLFRYVKIVNGQILISKDDEEMEECINHPSGQHLQLEGDTMKLEETHKVSAKTEIPSYTKKVETVTMSTQTEEILPPQDQEAEMSTQKADASQEICIQTEDRGPISTLNEEIIDPTQTQVEEPSENSMNTTEESKTMVQETTESMSKGMADENPTKGHIQTQEEAISNLNKSQNEQLHEEDSIDSSHKKAIDDIMNEKKITAERLLALSSLLGEFDEVKEFYSEDLETSVDRLVKWFLEKAKEKQNQIIPEPDYVIIKNGTETRVFLDNDTRLEMIIQKYLKLHILMMSLKAHINEKPSDPEQQGLEPY